jgi:hypothetical protein
LFTSSSLQGVSSLILFPLYATGIVDTTGGKFTTGVVDTSGNFPPILLTLVANLSPVSTTPAVQVAKFATSVVDTGGAPGLLNIFANLPKNLKWLCCYFQGLGGRWFMKFNDEKKPETLKVFFYEKPYELRKECKNG